MWKGRCASRGRSSAAEAATAVGMQRSVHRAASQIAILLLHVVIYAAGLWLGLDANLQIRDLPRLLRPYIDSTKWLQQTQSPCSRRERSRSR